MNRQNDLCVSCYGITKDMEYSVVVIPWGATEPHNQHLPYLTDAILSHDVAVDAAVLAKERYNINVMVMPPVPFGAQNPGQRQLKFCVHTRQETQKAILNDIVGSLYHQGFRRIVIINGHGGNTFKGFIRDLAVDYPDMIIASSEWYKALPAKDYFDRPGDHADELETSVMMHYHPELVDINMAGEGLSGGFEPNCLASGVAWVPRNWLKVSRDTGIGDPRGATALKGKKFAEAVASVYADLFYELGLPEESLYKKF